jgi:hypothetical protein
MSGIVGKNLGRGSGVVIATPVGADAVDGSNVADDAINSEHYTDGSIDEAHIADNAVSLAKMAGGTDGNIISYDASGDPVAIATGNDGQVLTSTGAGSPPAFEDAGGGSWTLIQKQTASTSSSIEFTTGISGYNVFVVMLSGIYSSGDAQFFLTFSNDGGSSWESSSYEFANYIFEADGGTASNNGTGSSALQIGYNHTTDGSIGTIQSDSHQVWIHRAVTSDQYTNAYWQGIYHSTGNSPTNHVGGGVYETSEAVNGFKFNMNGAPTIVKGDFALYGISGS